MNTSSFFSQSRSLETFFWQLHCVLHPSLLLHLWTAGLVGYKGYKPGHTEELLEQQHLYLRKQLLKYDKIRHQESDSGNWKQRLFSFHTNNDGSTKIEISQHHSWLQKSYFPRKTSNSISLNSFQIFSQDKWERKQSPSKILFYFSSVHG